MSKTIISRFLLIIMFLVISFSSVFAKNSSIEGIVKDAKTKEPLAFANVFLKGTSFGAATDLEGEYLIKNVPPGDYTLIIQYVGYKRTELNITLVEGKRLKEDILLDFIIIEGMEVVVTAQAEGQIAAINEQLRAKAIVNVVSAQRIQEIPDQNAAESVGRLPGVSIQRKGGEGIKVVIRGLSPKYNNIMVNGVQLSPTDTDDRSVDLSMISPFMLEGIEVTKAVTPDMDANAIGGSVNFKLRKAKEGLQYDLMLQGGYNDLKNTYNDYKIVGNIANRFFENKLGVFFQIDLDKRNRNANTMGAGYELISPELNKVNEPIISSLSLNDVSRIKKQYGTTLVLDYKIPDGSIVLNNFYSLSDSKAETRAQSFGIDLSTHDYTTVDSRKKLGVMVNSIHYKQDWSFLNFNAEVSHSYSKQDAPENLSFTFNEVNALENFDRSISPREIPFYAKNDLDNTVLADIFQYDEISKDREITTKIDIDKDFNIADGYLLNFKLGSKYAHRDREYDYNAAGGFLNYGSGQGARDAILNAFPWMQETVGSGSLNLPYPLFIDKAYDTGEFLKGKYDSWPGADIELMYDVIDVLKEYGESDAYRAMNMSSIYYDYSGNEYLSAGYAMLDFKFENILNVITGVRYEELTREYTAVQGNSTIGKPQSNYTHIDTTTNVVNAEWLPMIMVKYKPFEWFDIRFAYTNTLSRPDYTRIIPQLNIGRETVSMKNYKLEPMLSHNFDLYFSFYENSLGLFTIGGFIKNIEKMIFYNNGRVIMDPEQYGLPLKEKGKTLYTYINNPYNVNLWGIEASWQTHFSYLPGVLSGLVLDLNYTHIFSEAKYPRSTVETKVLNEPPWFIQTVTDTFYTARMIDQPNDIVNLAFGWDYREFSIRVSLLYQSDIFRGVNFWEELREITDDYWRWDLSIKQGLPVEGLQLFINVRNISGTFDRTLNSGGRYPSSEQFYGTGMDLGVRYRL